MYQNVSLLFRQSNSNIYTYLFANVPPDVFSLELVDLVQGRVLGRKDLESLASAKKCLNICFPQDGRLVCLVFALVVSKSSRRLRFGVLATPLFNRYLFSKGYPKQPRSHNRPSTRITKSKQANTKYGPKITRERKAAHKSIQNHPTAWKYFHKLHENQGVVERCSEYGTLPHLLSVAERPILARVLLLC